MKKSGHSQQVEVLYDALIPQFSKLLARLKQPMSAYRYSSLAAQEGCILADSGETLSPVHLSQVKYLFVRSTTQVNQALLNLMPSLRFVATATSGIDHLSIDVLENAGIHWCDAKGSNAHAVADYVVYALAALQSQSVVFRSGRAVVVGYGCVGRDVVSHLSMLGCKPAYVDPFVALVNQGLRDQDVQVLELSTTQEDWLASTTLLCIHTPLRTQEPWPTKSWLNSTRLAALPDGAVVLCAGRGEVLDQDAVLAEAHRLHFVLDVWPKEPFISPQLLHAVRFATPHIAGHSKLGKLKGAWQVFEHFSCWRGLEIDLAEQAFYSQSLAGEAGRISIPVNLNVQSEAESGDASVLNGALQNLVLQKASSTLVVLDNLMRSKIDLFLQGDHISQIFKQLRKEYFQHSEIEWC